MWIFKFPIRRQIRHNGVSALEQPQIQSDSAVSTGDMIAFPGGNRIAIQSRCINGHSARRVRTVGSCLYRALCVGSSNGLVPITTPYSSSGSDVIRVALGIRRAVVPGCVVSVVEPSTIPGRRENTEEVLRFVRAPRS